MLALQWSNKSIEEAIYQMRKIYNDDTYSKQNPDDAYSCSNVLGSGYNYDSIL